MLDRELRMVAATDDRLKAAMGTRDDVIGKQLFAHFPDNPDDPEATSRFWLELQRG